MWILNNPSTYLITKMILKKIKYIIMIVAFMNKKYFQCL